MKLTRTPGAGRIHDYNINLTTEELMCIARDGISDFFYTNKMLDLIKKEAERLGSRDE